jgi:cytolysin (calcineurin-like family phosphatase)
MIRDRFAHARVAPVSRRAVMAGFLATMAAAPARASRQSSVGNRFDVAFLFTADVHACRLADGLNPRCGEQGKTEEALRRHVNAINRAHHHRWPHAIDGSPTGLHGAGEPIALPLGLVIGGDITDDAGGQVEHPGRPLAQPGQPHVLPSDSRQLVQFNQLYRQTASGEGVRFPVYVGLGNHDLDRDGPPQAFNWYRETLRRYVKLMHMRSPDYHPPVPVTSYDAQSDCYSWDWGELHLVQAHRYAGDTEKGAIDSLPWIERDLARHASEGRPVIVIQHYGWDSFSTERWDPAKKTFTADGAGPPHWWGESQRQAAYEVLRPYNVVAVLHGHEHENTLRYQWRGLDVIKPRAAFLGGFAILRVTERFMDVVFAEVVDDAGNLRFTKAFTKSLSPWRSARRYR